MARKRRVPADAKPRNPCPICHQGFRPATDAQWKQRWEYHLEFSERHKKYLELSKAGK